MLVDAGTYYCRKHLHLHPEIKRPSASSRGYNAKWKRLSKAFLRKNPLCVRCLSEGRYVQADVVDHIIPHRGDHELMWDQSNWQPLCKPHHDKKTWTEDRTPVYTY